MIKLFRTNKCSILATKKVDKKSVSRWGILSVKNKKKNYFQINDVIEKPNLQNAPSNYAIIGRYILSKKIFAEIRKLKPGQGGELHITDAIRNLIFKGEKFLGNIFKGKYLDCGTLKGYINSGIEIAKDFTLKLLYGDGIPLPQSAGEDQLVGLLFTAALIDFSKDREGAGGSSLIAGTVAPLFLDAPFGQLDNSYQEKIAEILPELADQLCLMLSGSQGRKEVLEKLLPFGGRQFVIVRHNKADAPINFEEEEVSLGGRSYTQTLWNQKHDGSFFVSVS